jgi:hypothetical protein
MVAILLGRDEGLDVAGPPRTRWQYILPFFPESAGILQIDRKIQHGEKDPSMSHTKQAPAMILKNPSRPKEHWADKEIRKAAVEIDEGRYVPDAPTEEQEAIADLGLALGQGTGGVGVGAVPTLEEFRKTRDIDELSRHPRVQEAMERMRKETEADPMSPQAMEASWCLYEMNERANRNHRWPGQERWLGKENEEMRRGEVLLATEFYRRLTETIGEDRVLLGRYAYKMDPDSKSGILGLYVPNPEYKGGAPDKTPGTGFQGPEPPSVQVALLREQAEGMRREVLRLKLAKQYAEATEKARIAVQMYKAAAELEVEKGLDRVTQLAQQFVRVGAVQWPYATEWTLMNFSQYGVPTTHQHLGWRTALLTMVRHRAITEEEAELAFPVGDGPAAAWYLEQLWLRRHLGYLDKAREN